MASVRPEACKSHRLRSRRWEKTEPKLVLRSIVGPGILPREPERRFAFKGLLVVIKIPVGRSNMAAIAARVGIENAWRYDCAVTHFIGLARRLAWTGDAEGRW